MAEKHGLVKDMNRAARDIWGGVKHVNMDKFGEFEAWRMDTGKKIEANEWAITRAITKEEVTLNEELRIRGFDGTYKVILNSAIPLRNPLGEIIGAISVNQDITKRKQAEEALRESQERFQMAMDATNDGIYDWDILNSLVYWSPGWLTMLGYQENEITPTWENWEALLHPDDKDRIITLVNTHLQNPTDAYETELRMKAKSGDWKWIYTRGKVTKFDKSGNPIRLIGTHVDITERKKAEELLRTSELELKHLSSQLITSLEDDRREIALELHDEITAKLAAVKFGLEKRLRHGGEGIDQADTGLPDMIGTLKEIITSTRRIMANLRPAMIDDLGILPTINWHCREYQKIYDAVTIEKEIEIEEKMIPDQIKIVIFRIIQEAMNNIGKHSGADHIKVALRRIGGGIELVVADNGRGFNVGERDATTHILEGFGLTGMKERARLSGGVFSIESVKGKGTSVKATWPLKYR
jgi:two-component system sensor histidine kinase UhpB